MTWRRAALRWTGRLFALACLALLAVQAWFFAHVLYWKYENPRSTAFMRREQQRLAQRTPPGAIRFQWVPYERISVYLKQAV
ncbi:MAG: monofunctional biosynthetic peptidoglycan transglycosylase, partial [Burkholderiaceae bacterium]|nr:monofunctional biosynthetic peptidoglycan transglycosylase [Burkholderiaceae bacterium]